MSEEFVQPAPPGEGIQWGDLKGSLLIVEPLALEANINTTLGEKPAVRARVSVVDGPNADEVYPDTLIFPKVLMSQTRTNIGSKVLGRLVQGVAKPGQSAPWMLDEATADDMAKAQAWVRAHPASTFTQPAPPADPWQQTSKAPF